LPEALFTFKSPCFEETETAVWCRRCRAVDSRIP